MTVVIVSLPLLLGSMLTLVAWGGTALNLREIDSLFELRKAKDDRMMGSEMPDEDVEPSVQAEAIIASLEAQARVGSLSAEGADSTVKVATLTAPQLGSHASSGPLDSAPARLPRLLRPP